MSLASCSTSSGLMPAAPKKVTGSSLVSRPWCDMVSIRTVVPDLMRSAGGTREEKYPQTTLFGVDPSVTSALGTSAFVTSGLAPAGAVCAAADDTRTAIPMAAQQIGANFFGDKFFSVRRFKPRTCFDIGIDPPQ